jgi:hypothetical protein
MVYILIFGVFFFVVLFIYLGQKIDEAQTKRCERWKKEQMEAGMPEEFVDQMLLSDPDFIL